MALSGSMRTYGYAVDQGSTSSGNHINVYWSATQNTSANTSTITWNAYYNRGSYNWNYLHQTYIEIDGSQVYYSSNVGVYASSKDTDYYLTGGTVTLNHNQDGSRSFNITVKCGWYSSGTYNDSGSSNFTLDSIPHNQSVTISTNGSGGTTLSILYGSTYSVSGNTISFTNGTSTSVTLTKPSDDNTHYYNSTPSWSSTSGTITGTTTITGTYGYTPGYYVSLTKGTGISAVSPSSTTYYKSGTSVTITATVESGYIWSQWSDGNTSQIRSFTISGNTSLTANAVSGGTEIVLCTTGERYDWTHKSTVAFSISGETLVVTK